MCDLADFCDKGAFPKIHTCTFDGLTVNNLLDAHAAMEQGKAHGKWVIEC